MNKNDYKETKYNQPLILHRADPYVYKSKDGTYYFTASVPVSRFSSARPSPWKIVLFQGKNEKNGSACEKAVFPLTLLHKDAIIDFVHF